MSQLLAIVSAALYGVADFSGGMASRATAPWRVTAWSQLMGLPLLACGILVVGWRSVTTSDVLFGAVGGLFGLIGIVSLYAALSAGTMSIVSPITGALSALIPVGWGLMTGESIVALQWLGILLAMAAVLLIAFDRSDARMTTTVLILSLIASVGFAAFFIALAQTSGDSGLWPLVAGRTIGIPVAFTVAAFSGVAAAPTRRVIGVVALAGNADVAANIAILLALQTGPLGINTVLVALYPAFTVVAAMVVLGERPTFPQRVGIIMAVAAAGILTV